MESGDVDATSFRPFSARIGNPLFDGQAINLFLKSTSVTGLGSGSGGTQELQARNVRMVCTDTIAKREGDATDANDGWVTMRGLVAHEAGTYTLQFTAGIDTGDDYWAWRLMDVGAGTAITSGTFASDLVVRRSAVHAFCGEEGAPGSCRRWRCSSVTLATSLCPPLACLSLTPCTRDTAATVWHPQCLGLP